MHRVRDYDELSFLHLTEIGTGYRTYRIQNTEIDVEIRLETYHLYLDYSPSDVKVASIKFYNGLGWDYRKSHIMRMLTQTSLEQVWELIPEEIQKQMIYHLDMFQ